MSCHLKTWGLICFWCDWLSYFFPHCLLGIISSWYTNRLALTFLVMLVCPHAYLSSPQTQPPSKYIYTWNIDWDRLFPWFPRLVVFPTFSSLLCNLELLLDRDLIFVIILTLALWTWLISCWIMQRLCHFTSMLLVSKFPVVWGQRLDICVLRTVCYFLLNYSWNI